MQVTNELKRLQDSVKAAEQATAETKVGFHLITVGAGCVFVDIFA